MRTSLECQKWNNGKKETAGRPSTQDGVCLCRGSAWSKSSFEHNTTEMCVRTVRNLLLLTVWQIKFQTSENIKLISHRFSYLSD